MAVHFCSLMASITLISLVKMEKGLYLSSAIDTVESVLGVKCYKPTVKDYLFDYIFLFCRLHHT